MQSSTPSFYDILEVRRDASPREIRRSYLRLAQKYHPDLNTENENADRQFKRIRQVYEILSDPIRRSAYDEKPTSFHLDDSDCRAAGSAIVTEPVRRRNLTKAGVSESFQPNWATTSHVGGWLLGLAAASLAVAATIGVALMLLVDLRRSEANAIQNETQSQTMALEHDQVADRPRDHDASTMTEPDDHDVQAMGSSSERLAAEDLSADPQWWTLSVEDPEKAAKEWLSVESWDEDPNQIAAPEWTKLSVPDMQAAVDEATPLEAPEWTRIPVPELQPPSDKALPERTVTESGGPLPAPDWSEISVPDLTGARPIPRELQRPPRTLTPHAGTLYPPQPQLPNAGAMLPPSYGPMAPSIRGEVAARLQTQLRPQTVLPTIPSSRPSPDSVRTHRGSIGRVPPLVSRPAASDAGLFMSETQDTFRRRYIPPVSRYGGQLPDVPPAYSVPTDSWRLIDR